MASYREGQARVPALSTAVEHLEEVARIEQLALATGTGVQTDYLSAEAELVRARAELVRARHAEIAARVALARATGQLTMAWLTEYLENES
jgi:outer membrane protein TolC